MNYSCPFCNSKLLSDDRMTCMNCQMSDRNRCLANYFVAIADLLISFNCLNLSDDLIIKKTNCFKDVIPSIYGGFNSIDVQSIDHHDECYDFVACNHILEHVENDKKALIELLRITAVALQITVPVPTLADTTVEYGKADPSRDMHYRHYGADFGGFLKRFTQDGDVIMTVIHDNLTNNYDYIYTISKRHNFTKDFLKTMRQNKYPTIIY